MAQYVDISKFEGSWNNRGRGRRLQCPRCGLGVRMYVRTIAGMCSRCGVALQVLTELSAKGRPGRENATAEGASSSSRA